MLFLDDSRSIPSGYVGVRSYGEFVGHILTNDLPTFISFDHDLGEDKTGYDCAKWLVNYCLEYNLQLPNFVVHSQNPVGKQNIECLLRNFKKIQR